MTGRERGASPPAPGGAAMTPPELLAEREKELACIHAICLLAAEAPGPAEAAAGIARALRPAARHPDSASCAVDFIRADGSVRHAAREGKQASPESARAVLEAKLPDDPGLGWTGGIRLEYSEEGLGFAELLPLVERARDPSLPPERREEYLELLAAELGRDAGGPAGAADPALSPREREVAVQVRNGRTSKEIAALLGIAEATVERHRHNIRRKLRVRERGANLAGLLASKTGSA